MIGMLQEIVRDYSQAKGDGQSLRACFRRYSETISMLKMMVSDFGHLTGYGQGLKICCRRD